MDFTKIRLNGLSTIDLPIVNIVLPSDPYILKSADGLGPPEVDVSIAETLNAGGYYQGRRPQRREPVLLIGLNPDYTANQTVSDLRETLYGLLTPGTVDSVRLDVMNSTSVLASTTGYVKKMEIAPFSKDPAVQVTMSCLEQFLQAPALLYLTPASLSAPEIVNAGTAPAGFHMEVTFTSNLSSWTLTSDLGNKMEVTYGFLIGDKLTIDTRPGSRGIWVTRGGVTTNIIYGLSVDSIWHMLHGGTNAFTTSSAAFTWGDVYYKPQYWGI